MKAKLLMLVCLLMAGSAFAQDTIPNPSFERWTPGAGYSDPSGWTSLNQLSALGFPITCTKETPGSKGNSYVKLTNAKAMTGTVIPGVLISGISNLTGGSGNPGFAFTSKPKAFTGSIMYKLGTTDTATIVVGLTKWNNSTKMSDTVAVCTILLKGNQSTWKSFAADFKYKSSATPDSCIIEMASSTSSNPTEGNFLAVDDLGFSSVAGISTASQKLGGLDVYPNPSSNGLLNLTVDNASNGRYSINMIDMNGKVVSENTTDAMNGKVQYTLNTANLAKGVYMLKVSSNDLVRVQKVTIQ